MHDRQYIFNKKRNEETTEITIFYFIRYVWKICIKYIRYIRICTNQSNAIIEESVPQLPATIVAIAI